jgi:hypothetical protein
MPNILGLAVNEAGNAVTLTTTGGVYTVTAAEIASYMSAHPNFSNAQIEAQIVSLLNGRWSNRGADTAAAHIISRTPLVITVCIFGPGDNASGSWWL